MTTATWNVTRDNGTGGLGTDQMACYNSGTVILTSDPSNKILDTVKAFTCGRMVVPTREIFNKTSDMVEASSLLQMVPYTKENSCRDADTAKGNIPFQMEARMKGNGKTVTTMGLGE